MRNLEEMINEYMGAMEYDLVENPKNKKAFNDLVKWYKKQVGAVGKDNIVEILEMALRMVKEDELEEM